MKRGIYSCIILLILIFYQEGKTYIDSNRITCLSLCSTMSYAKDTLAPGLKEMFSGPENIDIPGGYKIPNITSTGIENGAPAISMISNSTRPGETIIITGANLESAYLKIWVEGIIVDVKPIRATNNRMQAVLPLYLPNSTMLIWPVKNNHIGNPIRMNGCESWWSWPLRSSAFSVGKTIRVFGKNLKLNDALPRIYIEGEGMGQWLTVLSFNPYTIEAKLPDNLKPGEYGIWCHNGSGGEIGWSERIGFKVESQTEAQDVSIFHVDKYGAIPNDGLDDWNAIHQAIEAAGEIGGGIVRLGKGTYNLSKTIEINGNGPQGIHLEGKGMGVHSWYNESFPRDYVVHHQIQGEATIIQPVDGLSNPKELLKIGRRYSSVRGISFLNFADEGKQRCISINAHDVTVDNIRGIVVDQRPLFEGFGKPDEDVIKEEYWNRLQDGSVMRIDAPGKSNIVVKNSEFHHPGSGIDTPDIRAYMGHNPDSGSSGICPEGTDYIQISNCKFRGYFDGRLEPYLKSRKFQAYRGWHNAAWYNNNSQNVIVENCDFAGADKNRFKVLTRSLNHGNTSIRELYIAHNNGHDLAPTSLTPGYHENKGEQFIFHLWYPQGGLFEVSDSDINAIVVNSSESKYAGEGKHPGISFKGIEYSTVPEDVDVNPSNWVVFICDGKGVGQFRGVEKCVRTSEGVTLFVEKPWRIQPDQSSKITLNAAFRKIIIYDNDLNGGPNRDLTIKSHGVTFWGNSFNNVIANNKFRNFSGGIIINSFYRCPTGWNLIVDNQLESIFGNGGDTAFPGRGSFYVDHVRVLEPIPKYRVWYSVGNIFRGNICKNGDVSAYVHRPNYKFIDSTSNFLSNETRKLLQMPRGDNAVFNYSYPQTPKGGIMMSLIENNVFSKVRQGITISSPVNWMLVRNNNMSLINESDPIIFNESIEQGRNNFELGVIMVGNERN